MLGLARSWSPWAGSALAMRRRSAACTFGTDWAVSELASFMGERHWQRAEVVSGPSRSVRRLDCRSLRYRHGYDNRSRGLHAQESRATSTRSLSGELSRDSLCWLLLCSWPGLRWDGSRQTGKQRSEDQGQGKHLGRRYDAVQMLRQPTFYVIYLMMTMLAFGGLVVTAQLNPMASSYHVDKVVVAFGMTALVLAITVDRLLNGLTRPFWGWVSDHIGRENAIFIAFILEAIAVYALLQLIGHPIWFVVLSGLCFFAWGNIFSLFPSLTATCTEVSGPPRTMELSTPQKEWRRPLPGPAPPGCMPRPAPGPRSSGR
jgi:hypothetical protein